MDPYDHQYSDGLRIRSGRHPGRNQVWFYILAVLRKICDHIASLTQRRSRRFSNRTRINNRIFAVALLTERE